MPDGYDWHLLSPLPPGESFITGRGSKDSSAPGLDVSQLDKRCVSFWEDGTMTAGHDEALALQRLMPALYEPMHEARYLLSTTRFTL